MPNIFINPILNILYNFIFSYPIIMSIIWIVGGLSHWHTYEHKKMTCSYMDYIPLTILVPCHNEDKTIELTCKNLCNLDYHNYSVIFVDDGSTDTTVDIIRSYTNTVPYYHLLIIEENKGKAHALNIALKLVDTPYVLIMDADTILNKNTLKFFIEPFLYNKNLGAVTGNPIPINRNSIWSKFQTAEFMSIIGLIKRTQHIFGQIFTVSGCATVYRTEILKKIDGFSLNTATEDIDITWKIQRIFKNIYFQPKATVFIQVPNRFTEYWKQRKRWAKGGWHLLRNHRSVFIKSKNIKLKVLYLDFCISYFWAFCFVFTIPLSIIFFIYSKSFNSSFALIWHGSIAISLSIIQMLIAININKVYDRTLPQVIIWVPWYTFIFFMTSAFLVVLTLSNGLFGNLKNAGKWSSPSRSLE